MKHICKEKQSATMNEIKCGSELEEKQFRHVDDIHAENICVDAESQWESR